MNISKEEEEMANIIEKVCYHYNKQAMEQFL
jgi:hypothetical protein